MQRTTTEPPPPPAQRPPGHGPGPYAVTGGGETRIPPDRPVARVRGGRPGGHMGGQVGRGEGDDRSALSLCGMANALSLTECVWNVFAHPTHCC